MSINRRNYPPMPGGASWPNVPPSVHEVLVIMRDEILTTREAWCQCAPALDSRGVPVCSDSSFAKSWCLTGAAAHACDRFFKRDAGGRYSFDRLHWAVCNVLRSTINAMFPQPVVEIGVATWNDSQVRTFEQVRLVLDQAVASTA